MPRLSKIGAAALAAFGWTGLSSVSASYLVVAGGGGGGTNNSAGDGGCGGGGAGGYRTGTEALNPTQSYSVIVGAGGASGAPDAAGSNGSSSVFLTTTSAGGGGGGDSQNGVKRAGDGGSGGGAGYINSAAGSGNTPSTSPSQGNNGGSYSSGDHGAGGGGATAAGSNTAGSPGAGGAGTANSISGSSVTYAGGGGGGGYNTTGASGGSGGGGQGGSNGAAGISGTANLGGGGGGGGGGSSPPTVGGNGGAGVVIISYVGAQQFGGGVVTSSGGNTIHTFTTSGTLSPLSSLTASYLIVAGGGGGGTSEGGGGGAGGMQTGSSLTIDKNSIYAVTVGAGGAGAANGTNSSFSLVSIASVGGGGGGTSGNGSNGGSGGGGGANGSGTTSGGTATSGQGNAGGTGAGVSSNRGAGGGGGAGAVGVNGTGSSGGLGGAGGNGLASSITGSSVTYAGGGGGNSQLAAGSYTASGGTGGGGTGGNTNALIQATNGTTNLGGGGGGGSYNGYGGLGGSGVVIISYAGSTQLMAGGTVTVAGGNVIHTFTSSGYLTPIVLVTNSLRFRASASAYLNRTFSTPTNNKIWTWSGWVKRGVLSTNQGLFACWVGAGSTRMWFGFVTSTNQITFYGQNGGSTIFDLTTTPVYRDPSAWYHIVLAVDTTQATASNRAKIYVNGVQVTAFSTSTYASQNTDTAINSANAHYLGSEVTTSTVFDGYMDEVSFVDGQALTPNSFGTFNGLGVWQPIRYGGSYGTNGFYLPFPNDTTGASISANYLVVAGGGGGGRDAASGANNAGGGGGAGGYLASTTSLSATQSYIITVGAGGAGGGANSSGSSGSNSVFNALTSIGGGGGARNTAGLSGGSGGGGAASSNAGGAGTSGQGNNGGSANGFPSGGGGGAGAVGNSGSGTNSGGAGLSSSISGSSVTYAGGGGGAQYNGAAGAGGAGGGGAGSVNAGNATSGTANTGGGGGGVGSDASGVTGSSGSGGSGIVIVSYAGGPRYTGGTITSSGGNTIHTFTSSGVLTSVFNDFSPNGNNWTGNNINVSTLGSTYDSMTDVPTLTSATTANYATLNPLDKVLSPTVINGNLSATVGDNAEIRGTIYVSSGKWYWEIIPTTMTFSMIGIGIGGSGLSWGTTGVSYYGFNGNKYLNGTASSYGASYTNNDVIGVALDLDNLQITFYKNNTSQGTITGLTAGLYTPALSAAGNSSVYNTNFGQRPFSYTPPTGFVALNTFNLPTPTIGATASTQAGKYFNPILYTGNGSSQTVTGFGFDPDMVWHKGRSVAYNHSIVDVIRGNNNVLFTNTTDAESNPGAQLALATDGATVTYRAANLANNQNAATYVIWGWKANGSGSTNTAGSITSTVSASTTAGFSIVAYTGNGTNGATVGHGLGVAPSMVIVKKRSGVADWPVQHISLGPNASLRLNGTNATANEPWWNSTAPSSTVFTLGNSNTINQSGETFVAYCFAQVAGYSAMGSYVGNDSADGTFIYTGFRPAFILYKKATGIDGWVIFDTKRNTYNVVDTSLQPNTSGAEASSAAGSLDIVSNGFKQRNANNIANSSSFTYIYMAFAESPFKFSNAR